MIVGKDAWKKGFGWFGKLCVKALAVVALMGVGVWGIIMGILALGIFTYEVLIEWKNLSKRVELPYKVPEYDTTKKDNGYIPDSGTKDDAEK